jgi:four helix bundle protein
MKNFRDLSIWQKSHNLALDVYKATGDFPREESYGLTSQIRRASVSIPANIAEGCGRQGDAELGRFLQMSVGSASELEYHLLLAHDLNFLPDDDYFLLDNKVIEVKRMISVLIKKLNLDRSKKLASGI